MRRRSFLLSVTAAASVGGCVGRPDKTSAAGSTASDDESGSGTGQSTASHARTATGSRTATDSSTTDEPMATLVSRYAYRHRALTDSFRIERPDRDQFAFVNPPGTATGSPPEAFELAVDGLRVSPETGIADHPLLPRVERLYTASEPSGWLPFDVETVAADRAALVCDGTEHSVPTEDRRTLSTVPDFVVESVSHPDRVTDGDTIEFTVAVRNAGDRRGVFLAGFFDGFFPTLTVPVEPGATERGTVAFDVYEGTGELSFTFVHADGRKEYNVFVENAETP